MEKKTFQKCQATIVYFFNKNYYDIKMTVKIKRGRLKQIKQPFCSKFLLFSTSYNTLPSQLFYIVFEECHK